uniref:Uncharacterized protein n=1 Tax=Oryza punctata TaxID=4537 RepID=A0A0E0L6W4_ORYPU
MAGKPLDSGGPTLELLDLALVGLRTSTVVAGKPLDSGGPALGPPYLPLVGLGSRWFSNKCEGEGCGPGSTISKARSMHAFIGGARWYNHRDGVVCDDAG